MPVDAFPRFFSLGDSAITIEFGDTIDEALNQRSIALAEYFDRSPFPGYIESVPAYASTTIFYDLIAVRRAFTDARDSFEAIRDLTIAALPTLERSPIPDRDPIVIPVDFTEQCGPDLGHVAATAKLDADEVIGIFTSTIYRVYMLGFLPGFSYMGEVDNRIATPRKAIPRTTVPRGSVGIAGKQTGIYSLSSPGGWQIIGRTDQEMFRIDSTEPCLLQPGDRVMFVPL